MTSVIRYNQAGHFEKIQAYIAKMPSLSTTVIKVLETCNAPDASANDLQRVISLDPVLTARVLKLINSAYYSLGLPVTSLTRAIVMLGLNTVKNLALSFAILSNLRGQGSLGVFSSDDFWTHSLCVGVIAKLLAVHKSRADHGLEIFFVAGLLHDLGKIPLAGQFAQEYTRVCEIAVGNQDALHQAEFEAIGMDHCTVGCMIAEKWRLGSVLFETLAHHHCPDEAPDTDREFVFIVSLANQFANYLNIGNAGDSYGDDHLIQYLNARVGVDWNILYELSESVFEEIEKAKIFLEVARDG